ncbi:8-amino-7-oxononanoate synthase [Actinospica sp.]|jgi:8-amino-7-oxononanoate synthase|uniref:8-amino-7-oxononanoate synthase n=1 Tax=Actinospica sp. TaxID=1872142 RepID=UPI002C078804|nr:8-amino-7-oxononanoate synthase [Actinospica sp.]HWG25945.1 8-amino-7-oxononanoate synthase [Actinospica sp.]
MNDMWDWLGTRAAEREAAGLRRRLRTREVGDGPVDLAGNDYLGLSTHPEVRAAAAEAVWAWGAGSTASRLVTGTTAEHTGFERELAEFLGAEAALVFSSGYLANVGVVTALAGPEDLLVSDALNHASVIDACRLSGARRIVVEHCSPLAVERALAGTSISYRRAFVLTESVFSVDGDVAPLAELAEVCRRHRAVLLVDEAHGVGVHGEGGRGGAHAAGLAGAQDVVLTVTLSKSFGTQGGAVVGPQEVIDHLIDAARPFIFDTALAPSCAAAARAALRILRREPELADRVQRNAARLHKIAEEAGLPATAPSGAVTSVILGDPDSTVAAAEQCAEHGVRVGCFRPPSVPDGRSRLRLTARADLTEEDFARVSEALRGIPKPPNGPDQCQERSGQPSVV